jgi:micrococcal nuclease
MNYRKSLKNVSFILFLGLCLLFIGLFIYSSNKNKTIKIVPSPPPVLTLTPSATFAKVTRVIDGDTIVIDTGEHVRYIGMNTPEVESKKCYASEATAINKNLVLGKEVKLEKDVSDTDKYGRLLRYVYVGDTFVGDYLVKNGDAKVMTVPPDTKYKDEFLVSQEYAKENNLGLWGKCP